MPENVAPSLHQELPEVDEYIKRLAGVRLALVSVLRVQALGDPVAQAPGHGGEHADGLQGGNTVDGAIVASEACFGAHTRGDNADNAAGSATTDGDADGTATEAAGDVVDSEDGAGLVVAAWAAINATAATSCRTSPAGLFPAPGLGSSALGASPSAIDMAQDESEGVALPSSGAVRQGK